MVSILSTKRSNSACSEGVNFSLLFVFSNKANLPNPVGSSSKQWVPSSVGRHQACRSGGTAGCRGHRCRRQAVSESAGSAPATKATSSGDGGTGSVGATIRLYVEKYEPSDYEETREKYTVLIKTLLENSDKYVRLPTSTEKRKEKTKKHQPPRPKPPLDQQRGAPKGLAASSMSDRTPEGDLTRSRARSPPRSLPPW